MKKYLVSHVFLKFFVHFTWEAILRGLTQELSLIDSEFLKAVGFFGLEVLLSLDLLLQQAGHLADIVEISFSSANYDAELETFPFQDLSV